MTKSSSPVGSGLLGGDSPKLLLSDTEVSITSESLCSSKSSIWSDLSFRGFKFLINNLNWSLSLDPRRAESKSPKAEPLRLLFSPSLSGSGRSDSLLPGMGDRGSSVENLMGMGRDWEACRDCLEGVREVGVFPVSLVVSPVVEVGVIPPRSLVSMPSLFSLK